MTKTAIVTGASRGIGHAIARALVSRGLHVVLVCRDPLRGEQVCDALRALGPGSASLVVGQLDAVPAIQALGQALLSACPRPDLLIHNAGVWPCRREQNEQGLERAFVVNHLAPFLLNHLLEEALARTHGRVVQVSAGLYVKGRPSLVDTPTGADFSALGTYATTKLCNLMLVPRFAARWQSRRISIDALHPGVIRTDLGDRPGALGWLLKQVKRTWKSPEQGAHPVVQLALDPALSKGTGRYFVLDEETPLAPVARDQALADALFEQAAVLCGLSTRSATPDAEAATR